MESLPTGSYLIKYRSGEKIFITSVRHTLVYFFFGFGISQTWQFPGFIHGTLDEFLECRLSITSTCSFVLKGKK